MWVTKEHYRSPPAADSRETTLSLIKYTGPAGEMLCLLLPGFTTGLAPLMPTRQARIPSAPWEGSAFEAVDLCASAQEAAFGLNMVREFLRPPHACRRGAQPFAAGQVVEEEGRDPGGFGLPNEAPEGGHFRDGLARGSCAVALNLLQQHQAAIGLELAAGMQGPPPHGTANRSQGRLGRVLHVDQVQLQTPRMVWPVRSLALRGAKVASD